MSRNKTIRSIDDPVSTEPEDKVAFSIGKLITTPQQRDAIHVAIVPVIAEKDIYPGREIGLVYGTTNRVQEMDSIYGLKPIGIADPYLKSRINKGESFWMFLFPNTVTGLRHDWTHPAFDNPSIPANASEDWLRKFADKWQFDYDEMVQGAQEHQGYVVAQGIDLHSKDELEAGGEALFWHHIENLTGKEFEKDHRDNFGWSCTC